MWIPSCVLPRSVKILSPCDPFEDAQDICQCLLWLRSFPQSILILVNLALLWGDTVTCRGHFCFHSPAPPPFETWSHPRAQPALDLWLLPHLLSAGFTTMSYRAAFTWSLRLTQALLHARKAFYQRSYISRYATAFERQVADCVGQGLPATHASTLLDAGYQVPSGSWEELVARAASANMKPRRRFFHSEMDALGRNLGLGDTCGGTADVLWWGFCWVTPILCLLGPLKEETKSPGEMCQAPLSPWTPRLPGMP